MKALYTAPLANISALALIIEKTAKLKINFLKFIILIKNSKTEIYKLKKIE